MYLMYPASEVPVRLTESCGHKCYVIALYSGLYGRTKTGLLVICIHLFCQCEDIASLHHLGFKIAGEDIPLPEHGFAKGSGLCVT